MEPFVYRIQHIDYAKKKAKRLKALLGTMDVPIDLMQAQHLVAQLLGYDDWTELHRLTNVEPQTGLVDSALDERTARRRRLHQLKVLEAWGCTRSQSGSLLDALAPSGKPTAAWRAMLDAMALGLDPADELAMTEIDDVVRRFEAGRSAIVELTMPWQDAASGRGVLEVGNGFVWSPDFVVEVVLRSIGADDDVSSAKLRGQLLVAANALRSATEDLRRWLADYGPWPFLAPIEEVWLRQRRGLLHGESSRPRFSAFAPEPRLQLRFWPELRGHGGSLEAPVRTYAAMLLAVRRVYAEAGYTSQGACWVITFRERNQKKETAKIRAPDPAAALLFLAVERNLIRVLDGTRGGRLHIRTITGPEGAVDVPSAVASALRHPVVRHGGLVRTDGIRAVEMAPANAGQP